MKNINRWALMRNTGTENVQEHSHMVAVIAHALAVIERDVYGGDADPEKAACAALFHDATEIFTGDMPTPVKYYSEDMSSVYKQIERQAEERLAASLPEEMQGTYAELLSCPDEGTRAIVKAADTMSAYIKCIEELKAGNNEFRLAAEQTRAKLDASGLRSVGYFLEKFIPPFALTIDELGNL